MFTQKMKIKVVVRSGEQPVCVFGFNLIMLGEYFITLFYFSHSGRCSKYFQPSRETLQGISSIDCYCSQM